MTTPARPGNYTPQIPYSIREATTQAFRLPGGRNFLIRLVLWTMAIFLLAYFFFGRQLLSAYAEAFQAMLALDGTAAEDDPQAVIEAMAPVMQASGSGMLLWLVTWLTMVSAETAFHKNLIRGTDHGAFPLRMGGDEGRVIVARIVVGVILYIVAFGAYIGLLLFVATGAGMAANGGGVIGALLAAIGMIACFLGMMFATLRLSPAAALSVRDADIRTIEGWQATRQRFWPMLGSVLLIAVVAYASMIVLFGIVSAVILGDPEMANAFAELETLRENAAPKEVFDGIGKAFNRPRVMIPAVIGVMAYAFVSILSYLSFWGVFNYVARLDGREQAQRR